MYRPRREVKPEHGAIEVLVPTDSSLPAHLIPVLLGFSTFLVGGAVLCSFIRRSRALTMAGLRSVRSIRIRSVIVLAVICCSACLWMFKDGGVRLLIFVQSDPAVYDMSEIILRQQRTIAHLTAYPQVVYRCADDNSKIIYPRLASDELTDIVMATNDECGDPINTDAIVLVHTAAGHFKRRERFRRTYANYSNTEPYRLKVVFLIGSVLEAGVQIQLEQENREHGDTVVGAFLDTYQNLTLKAVMGYKWLASTCPHAKLLIKMDDDVFFDVVKFFTNYWQTMSASKKRHSIHCYLWHNAQVFRTGKWKVATDLFASPRYDFPYCSGFFVVVSPDLIKPMYLRAKSVDFFWIDDVFLYGMVPVELGGVKFFQAGGEERLITDSYDVFKKCMKRKKQCPVWAVLTDGESQFEAEYNNLVISRTISHSKKG